MGSSRDYCWIDRLASLFEVLLFLLALQIADMCSFHCIQEQYQVPGSYHGLGIVALLSALLCLLRWHCLLVSFTETLSHHTLPCSMGTPWSSSLLVLAMRVLPLHLPFSNLDLVAPLFYPTTSYWLSLLFIVISKTLRESAGKILASCWARWCAWDHESFCQPISGLGPKSFNRSRFR